MEMMWTFEKILFFNSNSTPKFFKLKIKILHQKFFSLLFPPKKWPQYAHIKSINNKEDIPVKDGNLSRNA